MRRIITLSVFVLSVWLTAGFAVIGGVSAPDGASEYAPNDIIVKFRSTVADSLESQLELKKPAGKLKLSARLDELNARYGVREITAVFKDFKKHRRRMEALATKDTSLLTKKEKHILRRLKRAPKGAAVPDLSRIYKIELDLGPGQSVEEAVAAYARDPDVEYAELNYIVSINLTPNDPLYPIQWPLHNIGQMYPESGRYSPPPGTPDCDIDAPEAWDIETGNSEIIVAVVDTGVDYTHPDLAGNIWINEAELNGTAGVDDEGNGYIDDVYGYDFINRDGDPKDDHGHGTHCSGTIAARGDNGLDISGVCWNAKIMGLKFLGSGGSGNIDDATRAFYYAVENGADIVSNSWGGGGFSGAAQNAIRYAYSQGVIMVASAGNGNTDDPQYPAYYGHMFSVAATDSRDERAPFSNFGNWVDIAAPGVDVLSLRAGGTSMGRTYGSYATIASGTSMSCPHVAGACALLLSLHPQLSADEVLSALQEGADPIEEGICSSGRLNLLNSLRGVAGPQGMVWLDRQVYACSGSAGIGLSDSDLAGLGFHDVTVATDGGDLETITLAEIGPNTGIFGGSIPISTGPVASEDQVLQVSHGRTITVRYQDSNDSTGSPATATDQGIVDCVAPTALDVFVSELTSRTVTIAVQTDEPTTVEVHCGLACGGPYTLTAAREVLSTHHALKLLPLVELTDYYFIVELTDAGGNRTTADNAGACYSFTTPEFLGFLVPSLYPAIQDAIDEAWDGDTVWVADGVYGGPSNNHIDFLGKAITVRSENGPNNCIIDCDDEDCGFYFHEGETAESVVDGFTITNARDEEDRGGIHLSNPRWWLGQRTRPTISNCIIRDCHPAGITIEPGGQPHIIDCIITDNEKGVIGGGGFACGLSARNCLVSNNRGRALDFNIYEEVNLESCSIQNNGGAGIYARGSDWWLRVVECLIAGNDGPGIKAEVSYIDVSRSVIRDNLWNGISYKLGGLRLTDSLVMGNYSPDQGGGVEGTWAGGVLENCVFSGNQAAYEGGAVWSNPAANPSGQDAVTCKNCTFLRNTAGTGGGMAFGGVDMAQVVNCIFWENTAVKGAQIALTSNGSNVAVSFSDVAGGEAGVYLSYPQYASLIWGEGNIDADPCFALPGDYHIMGQSPCIDAGTNDPCGGLPPTDLYGNERIQDGDGDGNSTADMGAYEFEYASNTPIIAISDRFFSFNCFLCDPGPPDQNLLIRNAGGGTLNWRITCESLWLQAIPANGASAGEIDEVTVRINSNGLSHGVYTSTLIITDGSAINSPREVQVTLHIADEIHVPEDYATIQEAIDAAGEGSTVIVADGTYRGFGNRDLNFMGKTITVRSERGPENCIIDCQGSESQPHRGFAFGHGETRDSILEGFTIRNGVAWSRHWGDGGGGIRVSNSRPTIINCRIIDCRAIGYTWGGGGILCNNGGPRISGCIISGNSSYAYGGGIYLHGGGSAIIEGCIISNNAIFPELPPEVGEGGGGISCFHDWGQFATIRNCLITGNSSTKAGGISLESTSTKVYNCTIVDNSADSAGGIYFYCTENRSPILTNSIVWDNLPNQVTVSTYPLSESAITYNDIEGGWPGEGNIDRNPVFQDPASGDYHLRFGSVCMNAGDPNGDYADQVDIDGHPRVMGGRIDMGADEVVTGPLIETSATEFVFLAVAGGADPPPHLLSISNGGRGTLRWRISKDCPWLQVIPITGESSGEIDQVRLRADTDGLAFGHYYCELTISDGNVVNSPQIVAVFLTVGPGLHVPAQYGTIQAAIDNAQDGDVVVVADGTYTGGGNRDLDFKGKAIWVSSANGPTNCIIDCQGTPAEPHRGFYFHNWEDTVSAVQGFTISNGYADVGGGIAIEHSSPTVMNCVFRQNVAEWDGGAIENFHSSPIIKNCVFSGNRTLFGLGFGGGIDNHDSSVVIANCTFHDNLAYAGGGIYNSQSPGARVSNCILWADSASDGPEIYGDCTVSYSDVQGGYAGEGNIDVDPLFVDAGSGDYHLLPGSSAIDAGDPASDWSNEPWPNGSRVNMGAYGNTAEATRSPADFAALGVLASYWLSDERLVDIAPAPAGDGIANFLDFAAFADYWFLER